MVRQLELPCIDSQRRVPLRCRFEDSPIRSTPWFASFLSLEDLKTRNSSGFVIVGTNRKKQYRKLIGIRTRLNRYEVFRLSSNSFFFSPSVNLIWCESLCARFVYVFFFTNSCCNSGLFSLMREFEFPLILEVCVLKSILKLLCWKICASVERLILLWLLLQHHTIFRREKEMSRDCVADD